MVRRIKKILIMKALDQNAALVLFSGGQDSSIALAWALMRFYKVATIGFDYGQRHSVELQARQAVRERLKTALPSLAGRLGPDTLVDLSAFGRIGETAMTENAEIEMLDTGLPSTFVPGRNLAFLVFAAAHAYRAGTGALVAGMCEADYSGYPDCREDALDAQTQALQLGMDAEFALHTPLMHITKAASWALAEEIGGDAVVEVIVEHSHTCYRGERGVRHPWGYGCDACPACELRKKGWIAYQNGRASAPVS